MFLKYSIILFTILQNQEVTYTVAEEMDRAHKTSSLTSLVTLLTLFLFTILLLFFISLYKNNRLRKKIRTLEAKLK